MPRACRFVHPARPLTPYNFSEAMGRWLLTELERASLARHPRRQALAAPPPLAAGAAPAGLAAALAQREAAPLRYGEFVLAMPLAERSSFVVVTSKVGRQAGSEYYIVVCDMCGWVGRRGSCMV